MPGLDRGPSALRELAPRRSGDDAVSGLSPPEAEERTDVREDEPNMGDVSKMDIVLAVMSCVTIAALYAAFLM